MALSALRRSIAPAAATLALALGLGGLSAVTAPAPAAVAAPAPAFDCTEPRFFAQAGSTSSTQLYTGNYNAAGNSVWTPLGTAKSGAELYNALAFNPVDEYLYATRFGNGGTPGTFIRIERDGTVRQLGASAPALGSAYNTLWDSGEFDRAGNYYVASGNAGFTGGNSPAAIRKVSGLAAVAGTTGARPVLETITLTPTPTPTPTPRLADFAFKDNFLWAANYGVSATIYRIDVNNVLGGGAGAVASFSVAGILPVNSYGSAFTMTNGNLAFIAINGFMYQVSVQNPASATPVFELVNTVAAPANSASDATNCATAQPASLAVTKTGPAMVRVGSTITWTVRVTNEGPGVTSGFVLTDELPAGLTGLTVNSTDSSCTLNAAQTRATCNGGRLAVGDEAVVTVTATAPSRPGPIQNRAWAVGNEDPAPDAPATVDTDVVVLTDAGVPTTVADPTATGPATQSTPAGGTATLAAGVLKYTPAVGFSGDDVFTYSTPAGTVTVYVIVNPLAPDLTDAINAGTQHVVTAASLAAGGTGTGLTLTGVGSPSGGTVNMSGGEVTFTPTSGSSGPASYEYTLTDADGYTVTATVDLMVRPVASGDSISVAVGGTVSVPVLSNDLGTGLDVSIVAAPTAGTASVVGNQISYTAPASSGIRTLTYRVTDDSGQTSTATVTITVTPSAANDDATTSAETSVLIDVLDNDGDPSLVIDGVGTPNVGTAVIEGTSIRYTPPADFSGNATFTYTVRDTLGATATATVTVRVNPTAGTLTRTTAANTALTLTIADMVAASTGTSIVVQSIQGAVNGTFALSGAGEISFTPTPGFSGPAQLRYAVNDALGRTANGTVNITVTPRAVADSATTDAGEPISVDVLDNDLGSGIALTGTLTAAGGTATVTAGEIVFTPAPGFSGTGSVLYEIADTHGQRTTATLTVTVLPVAVDNSVSTPAGTAATINVLGNDLGTGLTITTIGTPSSGTAVLDGTSIRYTPVAGHSGPATFTYTVSDGANTDTATVTVNVTPTATADTASTNAGSAVTIPAADLLGLGTGTTLTYTGVSGAVGGTVTHAAGGPTFTPTPGFSGDGSFTYTLTDASGQSATGTIAVTVLPVAGAESGTTPANTALRTSTADLLAVSTGTGLTLTGVSTPSGGTAQIVGGDIVFTPTPGFSGTGSYRYTVTDSSGRTDTAEVTVTVTPVAIDDTHSTPIDTPITGAVLGNDVAANASAALVTGPSSGSLVLHSDGSFVYRPVSGYSGLDSFTYTLTADGGTDTATVRILVTPAAPDDAALTDAGQPVTIDVLANDLGTGLAIVGTGATSAGGTVTFTANELQYTPAREFSGIDTFTYTAEDAAGSTTTATVTVTVLPVTTPGALNGAAGQPITIDVKDDVTGTGVTVTGVTPPANGTAVINPDGTITFTPRPGFSGTQDIVYTVTDRDGLTAVGTLTVTIRPVALADTVTTPQGKAVTLTPLANDSGTSLSIISTSRPANGTVVVNADGSVTYTPRADFAGTDTFEYTIEDAAGTSVTTTVTVTVSRALPVTGVEPGGAVLAAFILLGLGGMGMLIGLRGRTARHRLS